jgi:hypothetical protein
MNETNAGIRGDAQRAAAEAVENGVDRRESIGICVDDRTVAHPPQRSDTPLARCVAMLR